MEYQQSEWIGVSVRRRPFSPLSDTPVSAVQPLWHLELCDVILRDKLYEILSEDED